MTIDRLDSSSSGLAELAGELPDVVLVLDYSGHVLWGNRAAERMFGRAVADSIGFSALDLVHPEDLELVLRSFVSVQNKQTGTLIEVRARSTSGWRLLEVIGTPVTWSDVPAVLFAMRDLTERRRFEVAHNEDARFRSLVQNSAGVTILVSEGGWIESVSGAMTRLLGHDPELLEMRPLHLLVREADQAALIGALELARKGATAANPVVLEVRMLKATGDEEVPFELSIVNLLDDPTVTGFIVSAHDITRRTEAEAEVRATLSLLGATLESTADGILAVENSGRITSFNRQFAEMWGLPESVLQRQEPEAVLSYVLPMVADPGRFDAALKRINANADATSHDTVELKDGRIFDRYSRPQRVDGRIVGRVWSFRDVTDARRTEAELRESEQRFRQVFNQGPLGIALVDLEGRVANANRALCRFLKRSRSDLDGECFESFAHPDDLERCLALANQLASGAIPSYKTEARFANGTGDVAFGSVTASLIRNELGQPVYGLRIIEDITERKRLELELASHAATARTLLSSLTPREIEVLELLGSLVTAARIAERLCVSVRTVETHLANAYRKLGVRTKEDAGVEFARLRGTVAALQPDLTA